MSKTETIMFLLIIGIGTLAVYNHLLIQDLYEQINQLWKTILPLIDSITKICDDILPSIVEQLSKLWTEAAKIWLKIYELHSVDHNVTSIPPSIS